MKCWILEGWINPERMQETLKQNEEMLAWAQGNNDKKGIEVARQMIEAYKARMEQNPDGYWCGYEGKSDYRTFCRMAQDTIRYMGRKHGMKFRAVKADIADDAKEWLGYKNPVENEGVTRYLYATL